MADEGPLCICPQCGKKYKLKEGFEAKSFSCKSCGATVWVAGKPPAAAPTPRRAAAAAPAAKGGRGASGPTRAGAHRRSRGRGEGEEAHGGRRGRGSEKPKSKANLFMAIGAVALIGIAILFVTLSGKDKGDGKGKAVAEQGSQPGTTLDTAGTKPSPPGTTGPGTTTPDTAAPGGTAPGEPAQPATPETTQEPPAEEEPAPSPEGGEKPAKGLGGDTKRPGGLGKHDPPADLGHLESTPPEMRKQIDEWIGLLLDPQAGRDSHDAKAKLAATGKPAFLPLLGAMAKIRDTITDNDTMEERLIESSLMLADQCLREMDGYLDAHDKQPIRPGTDKKYIKYILVLHYRRWNDGLGAAPLKDMDTMPGAFDPTRMPKEEGAPGDEDEEEPPKKGGR